MDPIQVRAKFQCQSVRKYRMSVQNPETHRWELGFVFEYEFMAVTGAASDSEENKKFFASTPTGSLKMSAVREDLFEPGKEYYLDFTPAS